MVLYSFIFVRAIVSKSEQMSILLAKAVLLVFCIFQYNGLGELMISNGYL